MTAERDGESTGEGVPKSQKDDTPEVESRPVPVPPAAGAPSSGTPSSGIPVSGEAAPVSADPMLGTASQPASNQPVTNQPPATQPSGVPVSDDEIEQLFAELVSRFAEPSADPDHRRPARARLPTNPPRRRPVSAPKTRLAFAIRAATSRIRLTPSLNIATGTGSDPSGTSPRQNRLPFRKIRLRRWPGSP